MLMHSLVLLCCVYVFSDSPSDFGLIQSVSVTHVLPVAPLPVVDRVVPYLPLHKQTIVPKPVVHALGKKRLKKIADRAAAEEAARQALQEAEQAAAEAESPVTRATA